MEALEVRVSTVYSLSMPTFIRLRVEGVSQDVIVEADTIEENENDELVLKKGNTLVGKFAKRAVHGWWITESRS
jgi:hypothetical protein